MPVPGVVVADAAQAYEVIPSESIYSVLGRVIDYSENRHNISRVQVFHDRHRNVLVGGNATVAFKDRVVLFTKSIARAFIGCLGVRFYRVGELFIMQVSGIPIGGPLSAAVLHAV